MKFFTTALLLLFLMTSCSKTDDPIIDESQQKILFSSYGGTKKSELPANGFTIENMASIPAWCRPSVNGNFLSITAMPNNTSSERTTSITVKSKNTSILFTISQYPPADITAANGLPEFSQKGGRYEIGIKSNIPFECTIPEKDKSWLSINSYDNKKIILTISANSSEQSRNSSVILSDCDDNKIMEIPVSQPGNQPKNVIFYTTTDNGKINTSSSQYAFGTNFKVISNTYYNGKGTITFDGDITRLSRSAFKDQKNLKTMSIPEGITSIDDHAFDNCTSLQSVNIPAGVTLIGDHAFYKCSSLTNLNLNDKIILGSYALAESGIRKIRIPSANRQIADNLFYCCKQLESVDIPKSVISVEDNAFCGCRSLKSLSLPRSVIKLVGHYCFDGITGELSYYPSKDAVGFHGFSGYFNLPSDYDNDPDYLKKHFSDESVLFKGQFASDDGRCLIYRNTLYAANLKSYETDTYRFPKGIKTIEEYAIYHAGLKTNRYPLNYIFEEGLEETKGFILRTKHEIYVLGGLTPRFSFPSTLKKISKTDDIYYLLDTMIENNKIYFASENPPIFELTHLCIPGSYATIYVPSQQAVEKYEKVFPLYSGKIKVGSYIE